MTSLRIVLHGPKYKKVSEHLIVLDIQKQALKLIL